MDLLVVLERLLKLGLCELVEGETSENPLPPDLGLKGRLIYQLLQQVMEERNDMKHGCSGTIGRVTTLIINTSLVLRKHRNGERDLK